MKLFRYGYTKDGKDHYFTVAVDHQWQAEYYVKKHFGDDNSITDMELKSIDEMLYGREDVTYDFSKVKYATSENYAHNYRWNTLIW